MIVDRINQKSNRDKNKGPQRYIGNNNIKATSKNNKNKDVHVH